MTQNEAKGIYDENLCTHYYDITYQDLRSPLPGRIKYYGNIRAYSENILQLTG
jgi:hypothetical protein